ncbi:hypothetical protein BDQ17DRAFT_1435655 [Cyathus striatus]|nr:hypothetical protein BDQ17DRAFT_1435655 [Cyathus striatus]
MKKCDFCLQTYCTLQGLSSHLSQSTKCNASLFNSTSSTPRKRDRTQEKATNQEDIIDTNTTNQEDIELRDNHSDMDWLDTDNDAIYDDCDPPLNDTLDNEPALEEHMSKQPRLEEEEENNEQLFIQDFPPERQAGAPKQQIPTKFEQFRSKQMNEGKDPWYPYTSQDDWELAQWLMTSGVSQKKMTKFLKLRSISHGAKPSFHNVRSLLSGIDKFLPTGPKWDYTAFEVTGNELDHEGNQMTETVMLWRRDPVECIKELIGNPAFKDNLVYEPCKVFRDKDCKNRVYGEMWMGDWWWDMQKDLPKGATVTPVILSSDKTNLSQFSGDKAAWPVYLSIGNIEKSLKCFTKNRRSAEGHQLFHECMRELLKPLLEAGLKGIDMVCTDGFVRTIYPLIAAYIADYPEQCLIVCCQENSCPCCLVKPDKRGDALDHSKSRDPATTLMNLLNKAAGKDCPDFADQNLRLINPFWRDFLPICDIFQCIMPDILHQLHKGVFKDHVVNWAIKSMDGSQAENIKEIDDRFKAMTTHPTLQHFKKGISLTSQWTGTEHKNMEKVFLGVVAGVTNSRVQKVVKGVLDFIYYAHFETHTTESLTTLDDAWEVIHLNKDVFIELGVREHFNISKLHNIKHYCDAIRSRGTADGFSTEGTERLHIDLAKNGYNASNKKEYTSQMTTWLQRQESIHEFGVYLQWAVPGYVMELAEDDEESNTEDLKDEVINVTENGDLETIKASGVIPYSISKSAPFPHVSVSQIINDYGAVDFLWYLQQALGVTHEEDTIFPVYKQFTLTLPPIPEVSHRKIIDVVHATHPQPSKTSKSGLIEATSGRSSTVLVQIKERERNKGPLNGASDLQGAPGNGKFSQPMAFVHWFKAFSANPIKDLDMFKVSLSTNTHVQNAGVIPISRIVRTCHLLPVFGEKITSEWLSPGALQNLELSFFLNPYIRHYDFYFFRYQYSLFRKIARQVEVGGVGVERQGTRNSTARIRA